MDHPRDLQNLDFVWILDPEEFGKNLNFAWLQLCGFVKNQSDMWGSCIQYIQNRWMCNHPFSASFKVIFTTTQRTLSGKFQNAQKKSPTFFNNPNHPPQKKNFKKCAQQGNKARACHKLLGPWCSTNSWPLADSANGSGSTSPWEWILFQIERSIHSRAVGLHTPDVPKVQKNERIPQNQWAFFNGLGYVPGVRWHLLWCGPTWIIRIVRYIPWCDTNDSKVGGQY